MREFCKFSPEFWSSPLSEYLMRFGSDAMLLAVYLQTNHHTNMLGVYFLPLAYITHDTGIEPDRVTELLNEMIKIDFCHYDHIHKYVWVVELALVQTGGALKESDKRSIHFQKQFASLPKLSFLSKIYEKYNDYYHLGLFQDELEPFDSSIEVPFRSLLSDIDGASMTHQSKKKEKNKQKEKEKKKGKEKKNVVATKCEFDVNSIVNKIFDHWKSVMNHPKAQLDEGRRKLIRKALDFGYDEAQLCQAISGCSYTPHNMGFNEQGQRYDGLHVIFRDGDQIDRFISNYNSPPKKMSKHDELVRHNEIALQTWLKESKEEWHEH